MPPRLCCCDENQCPDGYCIPAGSAQGCAVESAIQYIAISSGALLGTGDPDDVCIEEILADIEQFDNNPLTQPGATGCCWEATYLTLFTAELCIADEDTATLTITIHGTPDYTLVWKSTTGYDPLCTSPFLYSADDSDPPEECAWPERLCVYPLITCCPDIAAGDWPQTLYVDIEIDDPGDPACECGDGAMANDELTWDPSTASWKGVVDFGSCETVLDIEIRCNEVPSGPDVPPGTYEFVVTLKLHPIFSGSPGCTLDSLEPGDIDPTTSCTPFMFSVLSEEIGFCCPGAADTTFILHFSE